MSLKKYQKQIDDWAQTLEKPYWHPLSQFARLSEEVGEVGRLLNHLYGDKPIDLDEAMEAVLAKSVHRDANRFLKKDAA